MLETSLRKNKKKRNNDKNNNSKPQQKSPQQMLACKPKCDVGLCVVPDFAEYHTKVNL